MSNTTLIVTSLQMSIDHRRCDRVARALALMERAYDAHGPGMHVLPEYYVNHFDCEPAATVATAESVPGPSTELFLDFAARTRSTVVVGMLEKSSDPEHPFNTAAILGPDGVVGCYRKTHLWDLGPDHEPYRECKLFTPGETLKPFEVEGWKLGVMICADGVFPETPRSLALQDAELIAYPNCRERVGIEVEAAVIANHIPIAVCNPVGFNGIDQCEGTSRIVGPGVEIVASVAEGEEGFVVARLNRAEIAKATSTACTRTLRRPELYGVLVQ